MSKRRPDLKFYRNGSPRLFIFGGGSIPPEDPVTPVMPRENLAHIHYQRLISKKLHELDEINKRIESKTLKVNKLRYKAAKINREIDKLTAAVIDTGI